MQLAESRKTLQNQRLHLKKSQQQNEVLGSRLKKAEQRLANKEAELQALRQEKQALVASSRPSRA